LPRCCSVSDTTVIPHREMAPPRAGSSRSVRSGDRAERSIQFPLIAQDGDNGPQDCRCSHRDVLLRARSPTPVQRPRVRALHRASRSARCHGVVCIDIELMPSAPPEKSRFDASSQFPSRLRHSRSTGWRGPGEVAPHERAGGRGWPTGTAERACRGEASCFPLRQLILGQRLKERVGDLVAVSTRNSLSRRFERHQPCVRLSGLRHDYLLAAVRPFEQRGKLRFRLVHIDYHRVPKAVL